MPILIVAVAACGSRNVPREARTPAAIRDAHGTVEQFPDASSYVLVPDGAGSQRYLPENLPPDFRRHGLRVVFSGNPGEIPPNVRLVGTPLVLTAIRPEDAR